MACQFTFHHMRHSGYERSISLARQRWASIWKCAISKQISMSDVLSIFCELAPGLDIAQIFTCPTSQIIVVFFPICFYRIWKLCSNPLAQVIVLLVPGHRTMGYIKPCALQDLIDGKSTLPQIMAWCNQATSHYLNQCWQSSMMPYGITGPQ